MPSNAALTSRQPTNGDDVQPALHQPGGQLAGPGTEVEHVAGTGRQQPVDRIRRIGRTAALVRGRFRAKRQ